MARMMHDELITTTHACRMLDILPVVLPAWCCMQDELYMNGAVVLPHKEIKEAVQQPNIIL
jgi:hypothetical protein